MLLHASYIVACYMPLKRSYLKSETAAAVASQDLLVLLCGCVFMSPKLACCMPQEKLHSRSADAAM